MRDSYEVLAGEWREVKGRVKQQWGKLTDDDLAQMQGRHEELVGALQKRYGYDKARAEREVDTWLRARN